MFKGISNLASIMKQAQQMGGKMEELNAQLKAQRVTGAAGAGLVEVEADGTGEVLRVKIDPSLIEGKDGEMIEDLLPAAINDASAKAKALHVEAMKGLTEGFNLPGLDQAMAKMTGQSPFEDDEANDGDDNK